MSALEVVEKYRKDMLDSKTVEMQELAARLDKELGSLAEIEKAREKNREELALMQAEGESMETLLLYIGYEAYMEFVLEEKKAEIAKLGALVERKKEEVLEASKESKVVEMAVAISSCSSKVGGIPTLTARSLVGDVCFTFEPVEVLATSTRR